MVKDKEWDKADKKIQLCLIFFNYVYYVLIIWLNKPLKLIIYIKKGNSDEVLMISEVLGNTLKGCQYHSIFFAP